MGCAFTVFGIERLTLVQIFVNRKYFLGLIGVNIVALRELGNKNQKILTGRSGGAPIGMV